jgi:hypothetical protein
LETITSARSRPNRIFKKLKRIATRLYCLEDDMIEGKGYNVERAYVMTAAKMIEACAAAVGKRRRVSDGE